MVTKETTLEGKKYAKIGSIRPLFMHADGADMWLMALGVTAAIFSGILERVQYLFTAQIINSIGSAKKSDIDVLQHKLNKNLVALLYLACVSFVASFLEAYCWTRTGERQAARMRGNYLKAILRKDISYFDMNATRTSEVITSISSDSHIIQEAISEKVPDFAHKVSGFIAGYMVAFIMVWQLALAALPMALLLVVPAWLCGRSLMDLAGKIRREYNMAGTVPQQAISSIRTVYSFVGEKKIVEQFVAALNRSIKLGQRQGLIKGLAVGSNASIIATWAFIAYYGSRLVMSHEIQGGDIYAAGITIITGGM